MSEKNNLENFGEKVKLLVIDKLFLGAVVGLVAFLCTLYLHNQALRVEYQKQLFEKRVNAYEALLDKAKSITDELSLYYVTSDQISGSLADEILWQNRFAKARSNLSGAETVDYTTNKVVIEKFENLESHRRKNSLYFSKRMEQELTNFLNTLWKDYAEIAEGHRQKKEPDLAMENGAYERAVSAYESLRRSILESLSIGDIILG